MDIANAENRIVTLLAQTLQLTENVNLFRFSRPVGVYCGFTVGIVSGTPATADSPNEFAAAVTGSDFDRTALWSKFTTLFQQLKNGENHDGFLWIDPGKNVEFSQEQIGGMLLFTGKLTLQLSFI